MKGHESQNQCECVTLQSLEKGDMVVGAHHVLWENICNRYRFFVLYQKIKK